MTVVKRIEKVKPGEKIIVESGSWSSLTGWSEKRWRVVKGNPIVSERVVRNWDDGNLRQYEVIMNAGDIVETEALDGEGGICIHERVTYVCE